MACAMGCILLPLRGCHGNATRAEPGQNIISTGGRKSVTSEHKQPGGLFSEKSRMTHVPTGATTGKVVVTTPGGTLTSNVNFRLFNSPAAKRRKNAAHGASRGLLQCEIQASPGGAKEQHPSPKRIARHTNAV